VNERADDNRKKRSEVLTVTLVSVGHFFSHFYVLSIPSILPLVRDDFGVTNLSVGTLIISYAIFSAIWQYPMGVFSDRYGAAPFFIGGMVCLSLGIISMSFAPSIWFMVVIAAFNGTSDSVFHPSDYTIMTARVRQSWLGRSYAIHTTTGFLGFAAAPIVMSFLVSMWDWRVALATVGVAGFVFAVIAFISRGLLRGVTYAPAQNVKGPEGGALKFLTSPALLLMFLFYSATSLSGNGIQSFGNSALIDLFDLNLVLANSALAAYLWGITFGVLFGGIVADRMQRFDIIASGGYLISAALLCLIGLGVLSFISVAIALFFAGFMTGVVMPARDIMVKSITPPGSTGKAFGFVSTGFSVGGTLGPLIFASMLDAGLPQAIFYASAALMMLTIALALAASAAGRRMIAAQPAE
jgi:predicted MFS family arabinose efflux permease|tara:strand:- start:128 stop:1360 length:1233 start_codon:yes stop_codon:yes gene_type:complete